MEILGKYKNGNYNVTIFSNGTKVRVNNLDYFEPEFPENIDIKITDYCNRGCSMCHEGSTKFGRHGDILNIPFLDTLHPHTELAIGGGDPLSHPDLVQFLIELKKRKIISNITIDQDCFISNFEFIQELINEKLIYGIGVSLHRSPTYEFISKISKFPNAVIHTINGINTVDEFEILAHNNLKVLILGYKNIRRGKSHLKCNSKDVAEKQSELYDVLPHIVEQNWFNAISFDNLAIEQLDVRRLIPREEWEEFYMGEDGAHTMYVDLVEKKFAMNSTSMERYPITDNIVEMFSIVSGKQVPDCNIRKKVYNFISRFTSNGKRLEVIDAFTNGCCYWFAEVLFMRFWMDNDSDIANGMSIMYDQVANHFGCRINGRVYDISGDVTDDYKWEEYDGLKDEALTKILERDCILF